MARSGGADPLANSRVAGDRRVARVGRAGAVRLDQAAGCGSESLTVDLLPHVPFRATGITAYLSNEGTLEHAQRIAGHASPKTTELYDRTADAISVDNIERIVI